MLETFRISQDVVPLQFLTKYTQYQSIKKRFLSLGVYNSVLGRERKRFCVLGMVALQRERKINVIKLKLFQWERDTKTATVNDREDFSADAADIKCQPRNPNREGRRIFNGRFCSKFLQVSKRIADIIASKPSSGFGYFLELMSRKTIPDIIFLNFCG